jgi:hypothetical protein
MKSTVFASRAELVEMAPCDCKVYKGRPIFLYVHGFTLEQLCCTRIFLKCDKSTANYQENSCTTRCEPMAFEKGGMSTPLGEAGSPSAHEKSTGLATATKAQFLSADALTTTIQKECKSSWSCMRGGT